MKRLCKNCTHFGDPNERFCRNQGKALCEFYMPTYQQLESEYYDLRELCFRCVERDTIGETLEDIERWLKNHPNL